MCPVRVKIECREKKSPEARGLGVIRIWHGWGGGDSLEDSLISKKKCNQIDPDFEIFSKRAQNRGQWAAQINLNKD